MNENRYTIAGWLCIISAIIIIPQIITAVGVEFLAKKYPHIELFNVGLSIFSALLSVYLLYMLKDLFNRRQEFSKADPYIITLIVMNILTSTIGLFRMFESLEIFLGVMILIAFIAYNIISIALGFVILKMPGDLYELKKTFAIC